MPVPPDRAWQLPWLRLHLFIRDVLATPCDIRFAAAIALLFNVLMVVVAIIAIALTVPRDDPGVGR